MRLQPADGQSETIIASIGSILTSLLPVPTSLAAFAKDSSTPNALALRNKHVQILSLTSTLSRLVTGVLADYLCPPAVAVPAPANGDPHAPSHVMVRKRPIRLYRSSFAALCSLILAAVYAWNAGWLETEKGLWILSGGVGTFYGALFTLTVRSTLHRVYVAHVQPAIVSAHFGPTNFGLAWGMVSYFAALGSVVFSVSV